MVLFDIQTLMNVKLVLTLQNKLTKGTVWRLINIVHLPAALLRLLLLF